MKYLKELKIYLLCFVIFLIFEIINCGELKDEEKLKDSHQHLSADALKTYLTQLMFKDALAWTCPAPKFPVTEADCSALICKVEEQCPLEEDTCCFNGCVFTCLKKLAPPPVIDWEVKPVVEQMLGDEDNSEVRYCSLSSLPAPSKPVGCPDGFACQVENKAISSRGICVPMTTTESHVSEDTTNLKENKGKKTVYLPGGCVISQSQYEDMKEFQKRPYVVDCFCTNGLVECQLDPSEKYQDKEESSDASGSKNMTKN